MRHYSFITCLGVGLRGYTLYAISMMYPIKSTYRKKKQQQKTPHCVIRHYLCITCWEEYRGYTCYTLYVVLLYPVPVT